MQGKIFDSWSGTKLKLSLLIVSLVVTLVACASAPPLPPARPKPATIAVVLGGRGIQGFRSYRCFEGSGSSENSHPHGCGYERRQSGWQLIRIG